MKTEVSRKERTLASIPLDLKRQANEGSDVCVCVWGGGWAVRGGGVVGRRV